MENKCTTAEEVSMEKVNVTEELKSYTGPERIVICQTDQQLYLLRNNFSLSSSH